MITQIAVLPNLPKVESFLPQDMAQIWRTCFFRRTNWVRIVLLTSTMQFWQLVKSFHQQSENCLLRVSKQKELQKIYEKLFPQTDPLDTQKSVLTTIPKTFLSKVRKICSHWRQRIFGSKVKNDFNSFLKEDIHHWNDHLDA